MSAIHARYGGLITYKPTVMLCCAIYVRKHVLHAASRIVIFRTVSRMYNDTETDVNEYLDMTRRAAVSRELSIHARLFLTKSYTLFKCAGLTGIYIAQLEDYNNNL